MLRTTLALLLLSLCITNTMAIEAIVEATRSPWFNPTDLVWMIAKAPDRISMYDYAAALLKQKFGTLVFMDKLPMQNGSTTYAAVLSDEIVGISAGFAAIDPEPISLARLTRRIQENHERNMIPVND